MKVEIYNLEGEVVGETELSDGIFAYPWNPDLVHQALRVQLANARKPLAHTKGRHEVRGGGRKPWRQKGTGRARHGSTRSPIWVGGGVTHGPTKEKNYQLKMNKKMQRAAMHSALSKKLADNELKIVDSLKFASHRTKKLASTLKKFFKDVSSSVLLVSTSDNKTAHLASRNIPKVKSMPPGILNIKEALQYRNILIDKEAVSEIK